MVRVATVGATSSVGRCIVKAIAATNKHELVVLSSRPAPIPELAQVAYEHKTVDYADPASLRAALTGVHTVILTLWDHNPDAFVKSSLAVLDAAVAAGVKRFAPSEFSTRGLPNDPIEAYVPKAVVAEAVHKSGLEYTHFECGFFMNYLGTGTPGQGHMEPLKPLFDVQNCKAEFVGDGDYPLVFTHGDDVGRFVAASLDLVKWPEVSRMAGDRKTANEIVAIAEDVRGKKFEVTHLTVDDIKSRIVPNAPLPVVNVLHQAMLVAAETPDRWGYVDANLNKLLPEVKPISIWEFLKTWWTKVGV